MAEDEEKATEGIINWQVEYNAPENTPTVFSDAALVLHTENEFVISFYQTQFPPMGSGIQPKTTTVESRCVVRIVLTPNQMRRTVEVLQKNLAKYEAKQTNKRDEQ